jgi:hypothetical protein
MREILQIRMHFGEPRQRQHQSTPTSSPCTCSMGLRQTRAPCASTAALGGSTFAQLSRPSTKTTGFCTSKEQAGQYTSDCNWMPLISDRACTRVHGWARWSSPFMRHCAHGNAYTTHTLAPASQFEVVPLHSVSLFTAEHSLAHAQLSSIVLCMSAPAWRARSHHTMQT